LSIVRQVTYLYLEIDNCCFRYHGRGIGVMK
jgi:hypothetical protein